MEIYIFLLFIGIVNWCLIKAMRVSMPVPKCTKCGSTNTLGRKKCGFCCMFCGVGLKLADVKKYERDVEILLATPEAYDDFKQHRQSFLHMGFGTEKH